MGPGHVRAQALLSGKPSVAEGAPERLLARVDPLVDLARLLRLQLLVAVTGLLLFSGVVRFHGSNF